MRVCSQYGREYEINYNAKKNNIMIVRSRKDHKLLFPDFSLSGIVLKECTAVKYLGHYITDDLADYMDIYRQCRLMYAQTNMVTCKSGMCSV